MSAFSHVVRDFRQLLFPDSGMAAIPPLDGPLVANDRLEALESIASGFDAPSDVVETMDGDLIVAASKSLVRLHGPDFRTRSMLATFDGIVTSVALGDAGRLYAGVAGHGLVLRTPDGELRWLEGYDGRKLDGITALATAPDGRVVGCEGSQACVPQDWSRDLMGKGASGFVFRADADLSNCRILAHGLRFPNGVAISDGRLLVSESWAHRIIEVSLDTAGSARPRVFAENLVGYPAKLAFDSSGDVWVAHFARRTLLVEFVLGEDEFRHEMMRTIEPSYWVAPSMSPDRHCLEPTQLGSIKGLGIEKPWAPPRSYGLAVRYDGKGVAQASMHSRVNGRRHGIMAVRPTTHGLAIVSAGNGEVLLDRSTSAEAP